MKKWASGLAPARHIEHTLGHDLDASITEEPEWEPKTLKVLEVVRR